MQIIIALLQEYCLSKEQFEFVLDVTKFKTQAPWGQDPFKPVPTQVKSAFTRLHWHAAELAQMVSDLHAIALCLSVHASAGI